MPGIYTRFKHWVRDRIGPRRVGMLNWFRRPELRDSWGGPLNGQVFRQRLVREVVAATRPVALFETGTFRGTTARWLAALSEAPLYTVEAQPHHFGFAQMALRRVENAHAELGDSRTFLRKRLGTGPETVLVYLDAHWAEDLPLATELEIVFAQRPGAIVVIDDFEVEGDPGYKFDDYGPGRALNRAYVMPAVERHALGAWYPAAPSAEETGARRGVLVLARHERHGAGLDALATLRRAPYGTGSA